jgi:Protein of unknown function (DUF3303)
MKYMIEYALRRDGLSYEQTEGNLQTLLKAFSKWQPEDGLKVHAFLTAVDGNGGYVMLEASDPKVLTTFTHKFVPWAAIKAIPVVDVGESAEIAGQTAAWRAQVLGG